MELVINTRFGGFGISTPALLELVKRNAKCIEKYNPHKYYGDKQGWEGEFNGYIDLEDGYMAHPYGYCIYKDGVLFNIKDDYSVRPDKDLIEVVRSLGSKSFGSCAELKIVDVPDDIDWIISEYDGLESIAEEHRTWG